MLSVDLPDAALANEDPGVVDRFGQARLEDTGLETAFHDLLNGEAEDEVKTLLVLVEKAQASQTAEEGTTLEKTSGILLRLGEQDTGDGAHLGEDQHNAPDFALVLEAELTAELEFLDETLLLVRPSGGLRGFSVIVIIPTHSAALKTPKQQVKRNEGMRRRARS